MLANMLNLMLGKVISKAQNPFVEGREILDGALIANKAFNSILKSKDSPILHKLDIKNAYDHVKWSFLTLVMGMMSF